VFKSKVKAKDRVLFSRQLSTLINAGLPLLQALRSVNNQTTSKPLKIVLSQVIGDVEGGGTLANAMGGEKGGFGFSVSTAAAIYGWYSMGVYITAIPGGWIADRFLGQQRAIFWGGVIIALGHFTLAFTSQTLFVTGLVMIVLGTGLLKPNASSVVGQLYAADDRRRDGGFSIFYIGINLGAMVAPLICGYLGQKIDWHWGFVCAGFGMVLGLAQFSLGRKHLGNAGLHPTYRKLIGSSDDSTPLRMPFTAIEKKRLAAIAMFFVFSVLFWAAYEQYGSSFNLFADQYTRHTIFGWEYPSSWFQSVPAFFVIALAPVFAWLWVYLGKREPSSPAKFALGLLATGLAFAIIAAAAWFSGPEKTRVSPLCLSLFIT
jgi:POT family proton-dependent oligopeptide transporter